MVFSNHVQILKRSHESVSTLAPTLNVMYLSKSVICMDEQITQGHTLSEKAKS